LFYCPHCAEREFGGKLRLAQGAAQNLCEHARSKLVRVAVEDRSFSSA
jgi:hypothetical protein